MTEDEQTDPQFDAWSHGFVDGLRAQLQGGHLLSDEQVLKIGQAFWSALAQG